MMTMVCMNHQQHQDKIRAGTIDAKSSILQLLFLGVGGVRFD